MQRERYHIMLDSGRHAVVERNAGSGPNGNMLELDAWSPKKAARYAEKEGIELSDEHWAVIFSLRESYRQHGRASSARNLAKELEHELSDGQGRRHFYELFPGGPISQGCRIAGLPAPPYCIDPSFGSFC